MASLLCAHELLYLPLPPSLSVDSPHLSRIIPSTLSLNPLTDTFTCISRVYVRINLL